MAEPILSSMKCSLCNEKKSKDLLIPKIKELNLGQIRPDNKKYKKANPRQIEDIKNDIIRKISQCEECKRQHSLWSLALERPWLQIEMYYPLIDYLNLKFIKKQRIKQDTTELDPFTKEPRRKNGDFERYLYHYWIPLCLMRYWIRNGINPVCTRESIKKEIEQLKNASLAYGKKCLFDVTRGVYRDCEKYHILSESEIDYYLIDTVRFVEGFTEKLREDAFDDAASDDGTAVAEAGGVNAELGEDALDDAASDDDTAVAPAEGENEELGEDVFMVEDIFTVGEATTKEVIIMIASREIEEKGQKLESIILLTEKLVNEFRLDIDRRLTKAGARESRKLNAYKAIFADICDNIQSLLSTNLSGGHLGYKSDSSLCRECNNCQQRGEICEQKLKFFLGRLRGGKENSDADLSHGQHEDEVAPRLKISRTILESYNPGEIARSLECTSFNVSQKFSELMQEFEIYLINKLTNEFHI